MIWLGIATAVQLVVLIVLAVVVLSLARQVGILHERLSPAGMTRAREGIRVGERLPGVELQTLNGDRPDLSQADGVERLALLFVAADCPICRSVLPAFEQALIDSAAGSTAGYWVSDGLQMADYEAYCDQHRIDPDRFIVSQDLGLLLGIRQIPALVILDRDRQLLALEVLNGPKQVQRLFEAHPEAIPSVENNT